MARINFEDSIFKENRFIELAIALGGKSQAIGALVSAFFVDQRFWFPNKNRIPKEVWQKEKLADELIATDWAVEHDSEVYVRGSEEQFAWLFKKQQAGRRSVEIKRKSDQQLLTPVEQLLTPVEQLLTPVEQLLTPVEQLSTSLLFSPFSSLSSPFSDSNSIAQGSPSPTAGELSLFADPYPDENIVKLPAKRTINPEGPSPTALVWRAYKVAYEKRHGKAPPWNAKLAGQLKAFVSRMPAEDAPLVAEFYLSHNDAYYVKSRHPAGLMLRDAEKLHVEWSTGDKMTSAQAKSAESMDHYASQMERIRRGEL